MDRGKLDDAARDFNKAAKADPSNPQYAADAQIAQQHRLTRLVQDADKDRAPLAACSKLAPSWLKPSNLTRTILKPRSTSTILKTCGVMRRSAEFSATLAPVIALTPQPGKQSFHFKGTKQEILRRVLLAYGCEHDGR